MKVRALLSLLLTVCVTCELSAQDFDIIDSKRIQHFIQQNDTTSLKEYGISNKSAFNIQLPSGYSLLSYAIINCEFVTVLFMLNNGARLDNENFNGATLEDIVKLAADNTINKFRTAICDTERTECMAKLYATIAVLATQYEGDDSDLIQICVDAITNLDI